MSGYIEPGHSLAQVRYRPVTDRQRLEILPATGAIAVEGTVSELIAPSLCSTVQHEVHLTAQSASAVAFLHELARTTRTVEIPLPHTTPLDPLSWLDLAVPCIRRAASVERAFDVASGARRVERLTAIQAALGASLSDVAKIFRLSRQGLYKWLDQTSDVRLQEARRARFDQLEGLIQYWRDLATRPLGELLHERLPAGTTLLELLSAEALDEGRVRSALEEIAQRVKVLPKSPGQRLAAKGFVRRPTSLPSDD